MIEISHKDLAKYLLGVLILLAFLAILGVYMFFLSRVPFGANNTAGLLLAGQTGNNEELNIRIDAIQKEIDATIARVEELENTKTITPTVIKPTSNNTSQVVALPTPTAPKFLKISKFTAGQSQVSLGSQINFSYSAENTEGGVSFRMLVQCPSGITATYSNGSNICRGNIVEALPVDISGNYSVNFINSSSEPKVVIVALLASDITGNEVIFRDYKVMTVTIMPSYNYISSTSNTSNSDLSIILSNTPSGAAAPATISFTATVNGLNSCAESRWEFGDGITSENFAICPDFVSGTHSKTILENHQYNQPGTYTVTLYAGDKRISTTVYISSPNTIVTPPPALNSVITAFTINGQTSPTIDSGALVNFAYSGVNVSSYKLFLQCPANVAIPSQSNGSNICRTNPNDAVQISSGGSYQLAIFNTNSAEQLVTATIQAFRSDGTLSNSITRIITVRAIQPPVSTSISAPQNLRAISNFTNITPVWDTPSNGNPSSYLVVRKIGITATTQYLGLQNCNGNSIDPCSISTINKSFMDINVSVGVPYTYTVLASNSSGLSNPSNPVTATLQTPK